MSVVKHGYLTCGL